MLPCPNPTLLTSLSFPPAIDVKQFPPYFPPSTLSPPKPTSSKWPTIYFTVVTMTISPWSTPMTFSPPSANTIAIAPAMTATCHMKQSSSLLAPPPRKKSPAPRCVTRLRAPKFIAPPTMPRVTCSPPAIALYLE